MEAAAMAMIHSQPHLSLHLQSYRDWDDDDDDGGSSSSGEPLLRSRSSSSSSLRRRSYGDVPILPAGGSSSKPPPPPPPRHGNGRGGGSGTADEHAAAADANNFQVWTTDEHAAEAYLHVSAAPGYVSFEDVIGGAALYRDGSGRPLEAAISDPLPRTASRLHYAREDGRRRRQCRQPSPGPLGTCRGSAMHAIIKKYVHPLQGFLVGSVFCCFMPS